MAVALALKEETYSVTVPRFERPFEFRYHPAFLPVMVLLGRLSFGFLFLWSGLDKLINDFSATGFLLNATAGPLQGTFATWGESQLALDVINPLLVWGQILIGLALVFGIFARLAFFFAGTQMLLFYLARLWPENNPFLDEHIIYIGAFALLGALGAGRVLGLDARIERTKTVEKRPRLRWLLG